VCPLNGGKTSLRRMQPKDNEAKEEIRKLIGYLNNNRGRIHYKSGRKGGYPIGSGGIESANKFIPHTRMKRSGAWWVKESGNKMRRIRCAIYNGTYDEVFENYRRANLPKYYFFLQTGNTPVAWLFVEGPKVTVNIRNMHRFFI
jgi:hypothetical protein